MAYVSVVPPVGRRVPLMPIRPIPPDLRGLGKFKFKKIFRPVAKAAAITAATAVPIFAPQILRKGHIIGAAKERQLKKFVKRAIVPAAIAGAAFLIPGLGPTTLAALKGAGGFLSQFGQQIFTTVRRLPEFLGMDPTQRQAAEAAIATGQPPPASLPAEFLEAYMRTVTTQAQQHPEAVRPSVTPEPVPEIVPAVAEAGMVGGLTTTNLLLFGGAGAAALLVFGGGGRRRR